MLRIFHNTKYDFIKWWRVALIATAAFIVVGFGSMLVTGGIRYSIDFTGGTLMQVKFNQRVDAGQIRSAVDQVTREAEIAQFGSDREFTIRAQKDPHEVAGQQGAETVARRIERALTQKFGAGNFQIGRTEAVGAKVGDELQRGAIYAILISFLLTLAYLAVRFEWRFGLAAVIATAHDIFTTLAFIKIMNIEVSLTVIAAILTVIGYSLNDTIVIFDRVREHVRRMRKTDSFYDIVNQSVNETLPRSVLTHATVSAATLALLLFAGEVIRPFAWVMLFGVVTGTFSSIYIASSVLIWIENKYPRKDAGAVAKSTSTAPRPAAPRSNQAVGAR
ncbi:SecF protein [Gemmatirosa kalamazoonensis]|uniref:Protein-export membrane protein SecF n=1 Tax=Gemmatirosa kalamazoonensis TaxID=861299 RepID=W0RK94_9BACT|nr:protein translocase subunit SecF [Gemmatirosa kalamazoonensis]AHG90730.1 SecF protein [Gemmatirosa kalamazoonensis]